MSHLDACHQTILDGNLSVRAVLVADALGFTLRQPFVAEPGRRYCYSTADTHLLSICLSVAAGMPLWDWANDVLFHPLCIAADTWLQDLQGRPIGGSELFLSAREMASIGRLVLGGGRVRGKQLISPQWLDLTPPAP